MGNSESNPFVTNDFRGDNIRQQRELKKILKFNPKAVTPVENENFKLAPIRLNGNKTKKIKM